MVVYPTRRLVRPRKADLSPNVESFAFVVVTRLVHVDVVDRPSREATRVDVSDYGTVAGEGRPTAVFFAEDVKLIRREIDAHLNGAFFDFSKPFATVRLPWNNQDVPGKVTTRAQGLTGANRRKVTTKLAVEVRRLLFLEIVGAYPCTRQRRCTFDTLTGLVASLVFAASPAHATAAVIAALLSFALRFAYLFHALECLVAVTSFGTWFAAGSAASIVTALFSFTAWLATFIREDVRAFGADIVTAIAEEETEVVALAVVATIEGTAEAFARTTCNTCSFGAVQTFVAFTTCSTATVRTTYFACTIGNTWSLGALSGCVTGKAVFARAA